MPTQTGLNKIAGFRHGLLQVSSDGGALSPPSAMSVSSFRLVSFSTGLSLHRTPWKARLLSLWFNKLKVSLGVSFSEASKHLGLPLEAQSESQAYSWLHWSPRA